MRKLPKFILSDLNGVAHSFPTGREALLYFVKEDCPTCSLTMSLIESTHLWIGDEVDVFIIGQDQEGNGRLLELYNLTTPLLDDSELRVSFKYGLEFVPTLLLADSTGQTLREFSGFNQRDWKNLFVDLRTRTSVDPPDIDWTSYPESTPGCGSKSVLPGIAERLQAQARDHRLRAESIEIPSAEDPLEYIFEQGFTDGLPVVPPTRDRVLGMLTGTARDPQDVVGVVPPNRGPATVEKIAINSVMAGCKPEYLPVVIAAVEAVCAEPFNMHGVLATTDFVGPILIVNGPIRGRIGMNHGINALGQGNRANATIGRALQLIVRNIGGGKPGGIDRATMGQPGKYTFCFAENEEGSVWAPLHVERGFLPDESAVTVFAGSAPTSFIDKMARDARTLANSYAMMLATASHPKHYPYGDIVVLIAPEHVNVFAKDGWTKDHIRAQIQESTKRSVRELAQDEHCAEGIPPDLAMDLGYETLLPKFESNKAIHLVVVGGEAGKTGAYLLGWLWGHRGSSMTTRKIEE